MLRYPSALSIAVVLCIIALSACSSEVRTDLLPPSPSLFGTTWRCISLIDVDSKPLELPERVPTTEFAADGRISGFAGVNRYFANMAIKADRVRSGAIDISGIGATRMAGPPELMRVESVFVSVLDAIDAYSISDQGELALTANGKVRARFVPERVRTE